MAIDDRQVKIVNSTEGQGLSVAGGSYRVVISGKETEGAYAVIEMLISPGGGPGPHAHAKFQETFHVLEGEVELKTEKSTSIAQQGSFVNIPLGGIVHCFKNKTDKVARLWCVVVPAGLEQFFMEIAPPGPFGTFIPLQPMTPEIQKKIQEIAVKYGQEVFPPDYLDK